MNTQDKPPRILVVNALLDILNLFHDILNEQGYEVEISNFVFEGLTTIEKLQPNLIILDFDREGTVDEWRLLKKLKLYPSTATIPVMICMAPLFLTQDQEAHFRQKNIRLLFSPIDKDELLTAVKQML